jgi:riboflavin kinase/FMN adenylyltransferase
MNLPVLEKDPQTHTSGMSMTLIHNLEDLTEPLRNPVLTIGNFDGVHRGHLALFERVKERALAIGGKAVVLTFDPHPLKVMSPQDAPPLITSTQQKLELIGASGIDVLVCIPFTRAFSRISARDFVRGCLVGRIGVREIVVGYDYSFGHRREGNIDLLREMGTEHGFQVHAIDQIRIDDTPVSSTVIRRRVQSGDIRAASELLGRDYQLRGAVVSGMNRGGRLLGFPTANLEPTDLLTPKAGVYAVRVLIDGRCFYGLTNVGRNPTFDGRSLSVETHILDFSENLVGRTIQINFIERLRDEESFDSVESLARQIGRDVDRARDLFGKIGPCRA